MLNKKEEFRKAIEVQENIEVKAFEEFLQQRNNIGTGFHDEADQLSTDDVVNLPFRILEVKFFNTKFGEMVKMYCEFTPPATVEKAYAVVRSTSKRIVDTVKEMASNNYIPTPANVTIELKKSKSGARYYTLTLAK